jgi:hypothetical protein
MGFTDKLKSWFIIEDEPATDKKTTKTATKATKKQPETPKPKGMEVAESTEGRKGQVTDRFVEVLLGAMEKHNLDGFDYLEYKNSLKSLEKMPMDEQTRYQSAFAMAKTMGATPDKLVAAAGHYLKVLQSEEKKFEQALVNQRKRQIGGREQQIKDLENGIKQKTAHIKKLTQDIENSQKQLNAIKSEISGAVVKVENTKNDFIASYNAIVSQIQKDVANMKKFLK